MYNVGISYIVRPGFKEEFDKELHRLRDKFIELEVDTFAVLTND